MPDQNNISQFIPEVGAESAAAQISQALAEAGVSASDAEISQLLAELGADHADVQISQLTIELSVGSLVPVPSGGLGTVRFNDGLGSPWYVVPPISDSGNETRSKAVKSGRVTGKVTNAKVKFYPWDVDDEINVTDLEEGTNFATDVDLTDAARVAQSQRQQVNVPNAVLSTVRVEGDDTGQTTRDRIDEIVLEQAIQGVRR